ncbi:uncharacterized protein LOC131995058 isoform X1 [Stomoxys calcitrans]|uniref:uncharacterized protein LOC131995058 isoform X1 n=1 Tax=Stomoxys calcitrans TaxID=35570 RepID=UPI0027E2AAE7|nr:uncharacterized protein LOC131995058 isoform X1 [Stomoxys calcitrans]
MSALKQGFALLAVVAVSNALPFILLDCNLNGCVQSKNPKPKEVPDGLPWAIIMEPNLPPEKRNYILGLAQQTLQKLLAQPQTKDEYHNVSQEESQAEGQYESQGQSQEGQYESQGQSQEGQYESQSQEGQYESQSQEGQYESQAESQEVPQTADEDGESSYEYDPDEPEYENGEK